MHVAKLTIVPFTITSICMLFKLIYIELVFKYFKTKLTLNVYLICPIFYGEKFNLI